jgi:hypothetical protein
MAMSLEAAKLRKDLMEIKRALSVRQPFAEQIMGGQKEIRGTRHSKLKSASEYTFMLRKVPPLLRSERNTDVSWGRVLPGFLSERWRLSTVKQI